MTRSIIVAVVLLATPAVSMAYWPILPFYKGWMFPDGMSRDFGVVQRGTQLYHAFRIVNHFDVPMRIAQVRVGANRVMRAEVAKREIPPGKASLLEVFVDTGRIDSTKLVDIIVTFDQPRWMEYRFWVCATNFASVPATFDFGAVAHGKSHTKNVIIAVPGQPRLQITEANCASKSIRLEVQEFRGGATAVHYVSATLSANAPVGELSTVVELSTNNPALPTLRVPLQATIDSRK